MNVYLCYSEVLSPQIEPSTKELYRLTAQVRQFLEKSDRLKTHKKKNPSDENLK